MGIKEENGFYLTNSFSENKNYSIGPDHLDHIMIRVPDAPVAFSFLTKNLGLPVAWDLNDYGFFISGGISVGNINLELLQSSDSTQNQGIFPDRFGVIGLAFQPGLPIEQKIPVLDQKKILHGQPEPFIIDPGRTNRIL